MDEAFHLAAGIRHWQDGRFDLDRGNPPLVGSIAALPVIVAGVETDWSRSPNSALVGSDFLKANGSRAFWLMTIARWAVIPFSVWGGLICYLWAKKLVGERAGLLAVVLWVFCPQTLAYGSLVTGDMAATALGLTALFVFWKWLRDPQWDRAVVAGIVWGFAELSKFVWLLFYPLLPLLWLMWRWQERRERPWWPAVRREFWHGLVMVLLSLDILNLGYVFDGFGRPLKDFQVGQKVLRFLGSSQDQPSVVGQVVGHARVPLPSDYVRGLDEITQFVTARPPSYLRGEYRQGGWWYFYLYGWAVKLPLGTWLVILLASVFSTTRFIRRQRIPVYQSFRFLIAAAIAVFAFVTATSGVQFLRYTLPVLPLALIWSSQIAADMHWSIRWIRRTIIGGVLWTSASSFFVFPHCLSYFNEFVGGSSRGYRHLIDDSFDWGQDLLYLRRWLEQHREANPLKLAYWGWTDPRVAGIEFELPPRLSELRTIAKHSMEQNERSLPSPIAGPTMLSPGWYVVSVGLSHGGPWIRVHDGSGHEVALSPGDFDYFRDLKPVATAGLSIRVFHLSEADVARVVNSLEPKPPDAHTN